MTEENKKKSYADILKTANKNKNRGPEQKGKETKSSKPNQGFGGPTVVRRSGRGG